MSLIRAVGYVLVGAGVLSVTTGLTLIAFINSERSGIGGVIIGCLLMVIGAGLCNYAQEE